MIVSTNYFWMRILAWAFISLLSVVIGAVIAVVFKVDIVIAAIISIVIAAFLGAFNVLEPKVVQEDVDRWKWLWDEVHNKPTSRKDR